MAHGGNRPGAGRKSKAEELGLSKLIDECAGQDGMKEVILKLVDKAKQGSFLHTQLLMQYYYGKPTDNLDITSGGEIISIRFKDAE
jgi:hypothetical protein